MADRGHADARPFLVVWTSAEASPAPGRCRSWAARVDVDVDVVGPVRARRVAALLRDGGHAGAVVEITDVRTDPAVAAAIAAAGVPVVGVARRALPDDGGPAGRACTTVIAGRGTGGFVWALWHLHALRTHPPSTVSYGALAAHVGDLRVPVRRPARATVVLVHGGFWRDEWGRDLMDALAVDLSARGYATWNIEYRRLGATGGGWPRTRDDVVQAVTALMTLPGFSADLARTVLLGHSAGAQVALRAAAELRQRGRAPALVVALAGLFDLTAAVDERVGRGSIEAFLGGDPARVPGVYRDASPMAHLPLGVRHLLVHGGADEHVPPRQTDAHDRRVRASGDACETIRDPQADHFTVIDPTMPVWTRTATAIARLLPHVAPEAG